MDVSTDKDHSSTNIYNNTLIFFLVHLKIMNENIEGKSHWYIQTYIRSMKTPSPISTEQKWTTVVFVYPAALCSTHISVFHVAFSERSGLHIWFSLFKSRREFSFIHGWMDGSRFDCKSMFVGRVCEYE